MRFSWLVSRMFIKKWKGCGKMELDQLHFFTAPSLQTRGGRAHSQTSVGKVFLLFFFFLLGFVFPVFFFKVPQLYPLLPFLRDSIAEKIGSA